jgi:hypothetical protein
MAEKESGTRIYKIIAFVLGGLVIGQAIIFILVLRPTLERRTPAEGLADLLGAQFPGCEPQVTGPSDGVLRVSLKVAFDPTVDAREAHDCFGRVVDVASASAVRSGKTIEVTLRGASLDGGPTSATRTFDYPARAHTPE